MSLISISVAVLNAAESCLTDPPSRKALVGDCGPPVEGVVCCDLLTVGTDIPFMVPIRGTAGCADIFQLRFVVSTRRCRPIGPDADFGTPGAIHVSDPGKTISGTTGVVLNDVQQLASCLPAAVKRNVCSILSTPCVVKTEILSASLRCDGRCSGADIVLSVETPLVF